MTWPLLSISMTEVALVSFMSLLRAAAIIASSRSEITRFVSCSMYALPSVYRFEHWLSYVTLRYIKCFKDFIATGFDHVAHTANAGGIIRKSDHQGKVAQRINAHQSMFILHQSTNHTATSDFLTESFRCAEASAHN